MSIGGVKNLLELNVEVDEVLFDTFKDRNCLVHHVELLVGLGPFEIIKPLGWIGLLIDLTRWSSEVESPFIHVNLLVTKENLGAEEEREEEFVYFKE